MKLHPYQKTAVRNLCKLLDEGARPLAYAPTGAGKTIIAAEVFARIQLPPGRIKVFIVHTDQLRTQAQAVLEPHGVIVVTIQTLLLPGMSERFQRAALVCFDECHHLQGRKWRDAVKLFPADCGMFGLSATPYPQEMDELFTCKTSIARVETLLRGGYILPVSIVRPGEAGLDRLKTLDDRIDGALAYHATHVGKQAVHFEPTIELCERAAGVYAQLGVRHAVVTGKTAAALRDLEIARFRGKEIQVLISPVLLSEGFDAPCAEVLVAGRRFASDILLQQAVGRIRRTHPGKTQAFVIDCTNCCEGRGDAYFNETDETLFSSLKEAESQDADRAGRGSVLGPLKRLNAFNWIEIPADEWITEGGETVAQTIQRQEHADLVEAFKRAESEARREAKRERDRKRRADPEKREAQRERQRKYRADPEKREARRERQRKYRAAKKASSD